MDANHDRFLQNFEKSNYSVMLRLSLAVRSSLAEILTKFKLSLHVI